MSEITIVIPFYNRITLLKSTISSIKDQTFKDFEVLLIDDGSEAYEVKCLLDHLEQLNDKRFIYKKRGNDFEKGANGCRQFGFSISKSPYIKWFDSDDIMMPNFLEKQYEGLVNNSLDGILASGAVYNEDLTEKLRESWRDKKFSDDILRDYLKGNLAWPTPAGMWKKDEVKKIKPFSQNLKNGQEYIFHLHVITSDISIGILDESLFKIRSHGNSISKNKDFDYRISQFKSRVLTLNRLIYTNNRGKKIVLKFIWKLMRRQGIKNYPLFLKIFFKNIKFESLNKPLKATFQKLGQ